MGLVLRRSMQSEGASQARCRLRTMSRCTAPVQGHRTASGRANCPACGGRGRYRYGGEGYYTPAPRAAYTDGPSRGSSSGGRQSSGGRTRRLRGGRGTVSYSPSEWRTFEPAAREAERIAKAYPDYLDLFLCHAWDDREDAAKDFYDQLTGNGASVWFSETEVQLGQSLMREIDKGLAKSRLGIVLVTPAMLRSIQKGGIAEKELSALLHSDRLIPVAHGVTFDQIRDVSPLLASKSGLTINEQLPLFEAAKKVAASAAVQGEETRYPGTSQDW